MAVDEWAVTFGTAGGDWGVQPAQAPPHCTNCTSNCQCTNHHIAVHWSQRDQSRCQVRGACRTICFIPNVLKLNVLAAESSISMRSSSSPRRLLIDLHCKYCCCCWMPTRIDNTRLY